MKKLTALLLCLIITISLLTSCSPSVFQGAFGQMSGYLYTDFTESEKDILLTYAGEIIPFSPTNQYMLCELVEGTGYENGIRYYTVGNTQEEFQSYRALFSSYSFDETSIDERGSVWYHYSRGNLGVSISYYNYNGADFIDASIYYLYREPTSEGRLSNKGLGLPENIDGVHEVDLTASEHATTAKDLDKYLNGCPTKGTPGVLVIPVQFTDALASAKGYSIDNIKRIFNGGDGATDYYSVDEYYKKSSYGQLDLDITVIDEWFTPEHKSSYYKSQKIQYNGEDIRIGDQMILNEALDYLDSKMDLSHFDSDGNGTIDAVIMVNTMTVDSTHPFQWAYRYWNIYEDSDSGLYEYDGVYANDYIWMAYSFMHEQVFEDGRVSYSNTNIMNPQTFIHEFGHILGAEDYYDTSYRDTNGPMKGNDIMDSTLGDHNPFTKFIFGWIDETRLVNTDTEITLTMKPYSETGDTVILASNWDDSLGAFQEYFILIFYTPTGLNGGDDKYHNDYGLVLYHVNAELNYKRYLFDSFYSLANDNNAKSAGGSDEDLIEIMPAKRQGLTVTRYVFKKGDSLGTLYYGNFVLLSYGFHVDSLTEEEAVVTFTKN